MMEENSRRETGEMREEGEEKEEEEEEAEQKGEGRVECRWMDGGDRRTRDELLWP